MPSNLSPRIKAIQKTIKVPQTGDYDTATIYELLHIMGLSRDTGSMYSNRVNIQKKLGFSGGALDGIFGINTTTKLEAYVSDLLPKLPTGANMIVSKKGVGLIVESEISGESAYNLKYKNPIWPQSASGITVGIGYDLGYMTASKIQKDWGACLSASDVSSMQAVAGIKGDAARIALANNVGGIKKVSISYENAKEIFYVNSLPAYAKYTVGIYKDVAELPPDAQAALLSIVYNRGASLSGDRRREMKNIVSLVTQKNLSGIAAEIRSMKRLWTTPATRGLQTRREKEAVLVEQASYYYNPSEVILV